MRVRNRSGITLFLGANVVLKPMEWTRGVPIRQAISLARSGRVEIDWEEEDCYNWDTPDGKVLLWKSPLTIWDGYGNAALNLVRMLLQRNIRLLLQECWIYNPTGIESSILEALHKGTAENLYPQVGLCMSIPEGFPKLDTQYKIGMTMYESTLPLLVRPEWKNYCRVLDTLLVPCEFNKQVFGEFYKGPIEVLPLAIDTIYEETSLDRPSGKDTFTFFMHGTLTDRKAPLETLRAWQDTFPIKDYPHVRLLFKTRKGQFGSHTGVFPTISDSRIKIIDEEWSMEKLRAQLQEADAFVFPSKGEGYGMPPREAVAAGIPTIVSNNSGLEALADPRYTWPLKTVGMEPCILGGDWFVPDFNELSQAMHDMVANPETTRLKGIRAAKWFRRTQGTEAVAKQWLAFLDTVAVKKKKLSSRAVTPKTIQSFSQEYAEGLKKFPGFSLGEVVWIVDDTIGQITNYFQDFQSISVLIANKSTVSAVHEQRRKTGLRLAIAPTAKIAYSLVPSRRMQSPRCAVIWDTWSEAQPEEVRTALLQFFSAYPEAEVYLVVRSLDHPEEPKTAMSTEAWKTFLQSLTILDCSYFADRKYIFIHAKSSSSSLTASEENLGKVINGVWAPSSIHRE